MRQPGQAPDGASSQPATADPQLGPQPRAQPARLSSRTPKSTTFTWAAGTRAPLPAVERAMHQSSQLRPGDLLGTFPGVPQGWPAQSAFIVLPSLLSLRVISCHPHFLPCTGLGRRAAGLPSVAFVSRRPPLLQPPTNKQARQLPAPQHGAPTSSSPQGSLHSRFRRVTVALQVVSPVWCLTRALSTQPRR